MEDAALSMNFGDKSAEVTTPLLGQPPGLSVFMTTVFIMSDMMAASVVALPAAVEATGWMGLVLIPICGFVSCYTGDILGQCWGIVQDRFPAMRGPVRYPYPAIGMLTFGRAGRLLISLSNNFTLFGSACLYVLLASQNMDNIFHDNNVFNLSFCYWLMIFMGILMPCCCLGTPKDFKWVAIAASTTSSTACVILFVLILLDRSDHSHQPVSHDNVDALSFAAAFGTIFFAFGAHPTIPTYQNDMREPRRLGTACRLGFTAMVVLYMPVATAGYFVYGKRAHDNVLETVTPGAALTVVQCLVTVSMFNGYVIVINPLFQELEEILKIPTYFNYKRVILRVLLCCAVLFVAESLPNFGAILSLIGGSSTVILSYTAPSVFYLKLCVAKGPWKRINVPLVTIAFMVEIGLVAILTGAIATYFAIKALASPDAFTLPCFLSTATTGG